MTGAVVLDTNLTVLLIVGSASRDFSRFHKRLRSYTEYDFDILAETSNLVKQVGQPAHSLRYSVVDYEREFMGR